MPTSERRRGGRTALWPGVWGLCALCLAVCSWASRGMAAEPTLAEELVQQSGVTAGLIVHLGASDGKLEAAFAQGGRRLIHGLADDDAAVQTARKAIAEAGLYGLASVLAYRGNGRLPYRDNLVDLLIVSNWDVWAKKGVTEEELLRVVVPQGALCLWRDGKWERRTKPRPAEMDEWRTYRNSASGTFISRDAALQAPFELRWVEGPRYGSDPVQPPTRMLLSAGGRLYALVSADVMNFGRKPEPTDKNAPISTYFMRGMNPVLVTRNAYNGIRLWSSDKTPWNVPGMCAAGPFLFEAQGGNIAAYDGASGEKRFSICATGRVARMGSDGETLYVTALSEKGASVLEAFAVRTGELRWRKEGVGGRFLVAADTIYLKDRDEVVALDAGSGQRRWAVKPSEPDLSLEFAAGAALVTASRERVAAYSTKDGAQLWALAAKAPGGRGGRIAVPWKNGVAICGKLHDLSTGEPIGAAPLVLNGNCTPPLATPNFVVQAMTFTSGAEAGDGPRPLGLRLQCQDGGMVANGMLYSGPAMCACAAGGRMEGHPGFGTAHIRVTDADFAAPRPVLKGVGEGRPFAPITEDWPMYRHDACRSAGTAVAFPRQLRMLWKQRLAVRPQGPVALSWASQVAAGLTAPTLAGGLVYVADAETHRVLAVSATDGQTKWTFRADARVDAPPTIHQGRCLFGCRDGWVYCLRAEDGQLVWRSRAAPAEQYVVAYGQLESAWPVPACVVVDRNLVYASAGRTKEVDGGIAFCAFRLEDGSTAWARKGGEKNDVAISDGTRLYVQGSQFSPEEPSGRAGGGPMLVPPRLGLMDATLTLFPPWPRHVSSLPYSPYGKNMLGCKYAGVPCLLATWDRTDVFQHEIHMPNPDRSNGKNRFVAFGSPRLFHRKLSTDRKAPATEVWSVDLPEDVRVDGMMVTADALVVSGATGVGTTSSRGMLWTYARNEGKLQQEVELPGVPAFQSLAAMPGRLFVTTTDGYLVCLGE